jgi:hypothetical protein
MKIPLEIQSEWGALSKTDDPELNSRSIEMIRHWLDGARDALAHVDPAKPPNDPKMFGHGASNVSGITDREFDGVDMATLRYWAEWWQKPERWQYGREEAGRDPKEQVEKVRREIEARERT